MGADYKTAVWAHYRYEPSVEAAVVLAVLFGLTTVLHVYQLARTRTLYFIPFAIGGIFECIGYIGRADSATQSPNWTLGPYLIQTLFLLVAPALFAASIYMVLGRIILLTDGERHSIVPKRWLTKLFVMGDVLAFSLQAGGGGIMAQKNAKAMKLGEKVVLGGLFVQIIFFGLFIVTAIIFHRRLNKEPTARAASPDIPWRKHLYALYGASALIMLRSIFRVVEYIQGNNGYLLRHEWFLYAFDALPMLVVMLWFNWIHPSEVQALMRGGKWSEKAFRIASVSGPEVFQFAQLRDEAR